MSTSSYLGYLDCGSLKNAQKIVFNQKFYRDYEKEENKAACYLKDLLSSKSKIQIRPIDTFENLDYIEFRCAALSTDQRTLEKFGITIEKTTGKLKLSSKSKKEITKQIAKKIIELFRKHLDKIKKENNCENGIYFYSSYGDAMQLLLTHPNFNECYKIDQKALDGIVPFGKFRFQIYMSTNTEKTEFNFSLKTDSNQHFIYPISVSGAGAISVSPDINHGDNDPHMVSLVLHLISMNQP